MMIKTDILGAHKQDGRQVESHWHGQKGILNSSEQSIYPHHFETQNILEYYLAISAWLLPHLQERPIEVGRETRVLYRYLQDLQSWLEQGVISLHGGLSLLKNRECPDRLVFELEPSNNNFKRVQFAAEVMNDFLMDRFSWYPYVMTNGSNGLHLTIPLDGSIPFERVHHVARAIAEEVAGAFPEELSIQTTKARRRGRVFLNYLKNAYGQTTVLPYSLYPLPGLPVATPIDWEEALAPDMHPQKFTHTTIFTRLAKLNADPWEGMNHHVASIEKAEAYFR